MLVGVPGFEPGTSASRTLRANQAALHPVERGILAVGRSSDRSQNPFGHFGATDEQVREIGIGPVVDEGRAVEA